MYQNHRASLSIADEIFSWNHEDVQMNVKMYVKVVEDDPLFCVVLMT